MRVIELIEALRKMPRDSEVHTEYTEFRGEHSWDVKFTITDAVENDDGSVWLLMDED